MVKGTIPSDQEKYVRAVLEYFGMSKSNPVSTTSRYGKVSPMKPERRRTCRVTYYFTTVRRFDRF